MGLRIGLLTPSSNTVLEPVAAEVLRDLGATAHFARFRVVSIGLDAAAAAQFDPAPILDAAALLADARVDAICWSGASGAWLGAAADRALCDAITRRTGGVPATSATLALLGAFAALGVRRYGLVTPYLAPVQRAILDRWQAEHGLLCAAERHLEDPGNYSFAQHGEPVVEALVRQVAAARPDGIAIHCTNFRGTRVAARLEGVLGLPVLDSIAVSLWGALAAAGADPAPLAARWGRVFALPPAAAAGGLPGAVR